MKNNKTAIIARIGVTAALYAILTILVAPLSYGPVQFRFSEALCILPLIFPECAIGVTLGCFIANFFGNGVLDIVLGTLATLVSSSITALVGKIIKNQPLKLTLGALSPVLFNAFIIPFTFLAVTDLKEFYFFNAFTIAVGEIVCVGILGSLLYFAFVRIMIKNQENKQENTPSSKYLVERLEDERLIKPLALFFHNKWKVPVSSYEESMLSSLKEKSGTPSWFYVLENGEFIAGLGIIENDFHKRLDLSPNICAVFVMEDYRKQGIAKKLLDTACQYLASCKVEDVYLITTHTTFYEKCGFSFYGMIEENDGNLVRCYHRKCKK